MNFKIGDCFVCDVNYNRLVNTLVVGKKYRIIDIIVINQNKKQYAMIVIPNDIFQDIYWKIKNTIFNFKFRDN